MDTYSNTNGDPAALAAVFIVFGVVGIIAYVVNAVFLGMIFKKAGVESWKAWVPVYNVWVMLELGGQKGWLSLLLLLSWIPVLGFVAAVVSAVFTAIAAYKIGLGFGKEGVFVLLYIFLPIVWLIWLAVDKTAVWKQSAAVAPQAGNGPTPPQTPSQPAAM
jgi:hypothetical protein